MPIIQKGVQETPGLVKGIKGVLALKTPIPDGYPHYIAVFPFDETIAIFPVGASAGGPDIVLDAPIKELAVNELAAIDTEHRDRDAVPGTFNAFLDPAVGIVQKRAFSGPP
jgi:hypothetical protein